MNMKWLTGGWSLFLLAGSLSVNGQVDSTGTGNTIQSTVDRAQWEADSGMIRRLADTIFTDGRAYDNLRVLTKKVGARLSGSPGYYKAERWGWQALEEAQADKVSMQECMVPHWVRGGKDTAHYYGPGISGGLDVIALGNSVGSARPLDAKVILVHNFDELEARKDEVKGKIVFYNYPFNPLFVETFQAYGDAVRYRGGGASRAAKYGAVGVLVRSMSEGVDNAPHTGALIYSDSTQKIPAAAVGLRDADRLAALLEGHADLNIAMWTHGQMLPDTLAHNVIGELKGTIFPDQYITVGGHLDSWDPAEGAMDDGAGCVQSIEVLRALRAIGYKPRHTIRVVLFANEENGGRGGRKYATAAKEAGEHHLLGLESDAGGFTPRAFTLSLTDDKLAQIRPWIELLRPYGVYGFEKGGGGADTNPLQGAVGAVVGELHPDSQRYFDYHHARTDVLENVNKRELELGTVNMAALIYLVDKYGWNP